MGLAGSGLGATLRDYGRFGQFVLGDGVIQTETGDERVVPDGWFQEAGKAHTIGGKSVDYGYLWWPLSKRDPIHDGAFQAIGIFGQHMYINPREKVVIVVLSARPKPNATDDPTTVADAPFFAAVARALQ
jgi:CubicO group peptidase (beta-lactamase class C family)